MLPKYAASLILCLALTFSLIAQDGTLDVSFGNGGVFELEDTNTDVRAGGIALTEDQKIIAVGNISDGTDTYNSILRLNSDGSLDTTYGTNGYTLIPFGPSLANRYIEVFIQADGKIVAAGHVFGSEDTIVISRFLPNGSLDTSFGDSGHIIIEISPIQYFGSIISSENSFFVTGFSGTLDMEMNLLLAKYDADGSLDPTFGNDGIVLEDYGPDSVWSREAILDGLGNLYICVNTSPAFPDDPYQTQILKYQPNGDIDTSFGENGTLVIDTNESYTRGTIQFDGDGKLLVAYTNDNGDIFYNPTFISRYLENGDLDPSFGYMGISEVDFNALIPRKIIVQPNGRIILAGNLSGSEAGTFAIARLYPNGSPDIFFGDGGKVSESFEMTDVLLQEDGKLLGFGHTWWFTNELNFVWARYNNDPLNVAEFSNSITSISPNPSQGEFVLQFESELAQELPYQIADVTGKIVQEGFISGSKSSIDLSNTHNGVYFLNIENSTFKLIKE
ncbi:T9SS type A sorting domain-containing protein [Aureisphaera sp.]